MNIRVVVVDDQQYVCQFIVGLLTGENGIEIVGKASSGEEALTIAKTLQPDVMLMDLKMPGIGGLEATRRLAYQVPHTKVVVITALEEVSFPTRLFQAGALGYITKGAEKSEIVTAIKHAMAEKRYISPAIAQKVALHSIDNPEALSPFEQLSDRELQICIMIINCEKVQDISDKLCLSPKTVNTYRYRIFEKLGISGDVELTRLAIRHGLLDFDDI